jgi:glutathione synthase/RimK-type ligase-like ATP-grasp enzyme
MILLAGIPSEPPLALVCEALDRLDVPYVLFNQRQVARARIRLTLADGLVDGHLELGEERRRLCDFSAVYSRLIDDRSLPELRDEPPDSAACTHSRRFHEVFHRWTDVMPGRVVNRVGAMASNGSKPFQAQLIRAQGFSVPETLITNDPEQVREFRKRHGRIIYKSISGVRSIVQTLTDADEARLERIRWCPTQFQRQIDGEDVRVHVVAKDVFASAITSNVTDYRYAGRQDGGSAELRAVELDDELAERCIRLAQTLELAFAGIDLKVTPDGQVYCFEVNPSPAYSYYEQSTGQQISSALATYLAQQS